MFMNWCHLELMSVSPLHSNSKKVQTLLLLCWWQNPARLQSGNRAHCVMKREEKEVAGYWASLHGGLAVAWPMRRVFFA